MDEFQLTVSSVRKLIDDTRNQTHSQGERNYEV